MKKPRTNTSAMKAGGADQPGRQRQQQRHDRRHAERPVHDDARAHLVRQRPAIRAEDAGRDRVGGGDHAGHLDVEAVDPDQVARQPQRQRNEGAEREEVVEPEAPHPHVAQRRELGGKAPHRRAFLAALDQDRVVLRGEPEHHAPSRRARRPSPAPPPASPNATITNGATNLVTAAPTLPTPKMPSAVPCLFCG